MLQGAHVCSIECQSVCDFLMVTAVMKRPFPFFCLISNFKSAFRNLLELFASHLSKHGTNKTSDDPPICSRAERKLRRRFPVAFVLEDRNVAAALKRSVCTL